MATRGRGNKVPIDVETLTKLASIQCNDREMAAYFGMNADAFARRRRKEKELQTAIDAGKHKGHANLRRVQMRIAEDGSAAMAIWLGKIWLDQRDPTQGVGAAIDLPDTSTSEIRERFVQRLVQLSKIKTPGPVQ